MQHRYHVGQMLELRSAPRHSNRPAGLCKVLLCLPHDSGPVLYRVQSLNERNERVVEETDLAPTLETADPSPTKAESFFVSIRVGRK